MRDRPAEAGPATFAGGGGRQGGTRAVGGLWLGRLRRWGALALAALTVVVAQAPSAAGGPSDPRRERERVRQRRAQLAAQVDALRAKDAEVRAALDALNADVAAQQALLAQAEQALAAATRRLAEARAAEARAEAALVRLRARLAAMAVEAYVGQGRARAELGSLLRSGDLNAAVRRSTLVDAVFGSTTEVADRMRAVRQDLAVARQEAARAVGDARARREEVARRARVLTAARDRQAAFADAVEQRIEARLAEAASLARLDAQLSAEIVRQQEELARRNRGVRAPRPGGEVPRGSVPLRNVRGIWVHVSIADRLEGLLAAAEADGFVLGGAGYRDPADQQRLREANCPDPQRSPASACRPPTARPGRSMHEQGLAVDFTYQGRVIASRSSPAFRWLAANAGRFGFYNLPSEPWHWSVNGN